MSSDPFPIQTEPDPGAPISLRKVRAKHIGAKDFTIVLNRTGLGIVNDDPELVNVGITDREAQATYFLRLNVSMPAYLRKYLEMAYPEDEREADLDSMYKYAASNNELKQIIGLIQLVAGSANIARKANKGISFFIEEPETHLHPLRERRIMLVLKAIIDEYGPKPDKEQAHA